MKKFFNVLIFSILVFLAFKINISADGTNLISTEVGTCMDLLGEEIANYIQVAFTIIKIGSIIVLIVYSMIDFVKSITEKEEDLIVKVKKFGKRLILLIIILIMPTIIDSLGNLAGYPDILCGIK